MAKNSIKKDMEMIDKQEKSLRKYREKRQCDCMHKRDGGPSLGKSKDPGDGNLVYQCWCCRKKVDLERIDQQKLEDACKLIDKAIDIIKLSCSTTDAADKELVEKLGKVQYRVRNLIPDAYKTALKANSKKGKKKESSIRYC